MVRAERRPSVRNAAVSLLTLVVSASLVQTQRGGAWDEQFPHAADLLPRRPAAARGAGGDASRLYAPGFYTGYGVKTIPGGREGIEDKRYAEAEKQAARAAAVDREAALITAAAQILEQGTR
jgi:N-acetylated-alpha-linked acidic dipeptidase